jgi:nucleoside-diphosphate-sugar epimerase
VARLVAGEHGVALMTEDRGASNAKARRELGWTPAYPSWRQGFRSGLGTGYMTAKVS